MGFLLRISAGLGGLAVVVITCALLVGIAQHPDASWIAFVSSRPRINSYDINRINPDGSQAERLAVVVGSVPSLAWSPDGTRLAVVSHLDRDALTVMDLAGRSQRLLVDSVAAIQTLAWSPDGQWIAFAASSAPASGEPSYLYRVQIHSGATRQLTSATAGAATEALIYSNLAWSPDGEWLVFDASGSRDRRRAVYRVSAAGGEPALLAEGCCADWSPDGAWILYISMGEDGLRHLFRVPVVGGQAEQINTTALDVSGQVEWSPDGAWLVFVTFDGQSSRTLYRVRADGSDLQPIVSGTLQLPVSWSPDGEWLVFSMYGATTVTFQPGIYRVRADGRDLELLTDGRGISYVPAWSPEFTGSFRSRLLLLAGMTLVALAIAAQRALPLPRSS